MGFRGDKYLKYDQYANALIEISFIHRYYVCLSIISGLSICRDGHLYEDSEFRLRNRLVV